MKKKDETFDEELLDAIIKHGGTRLFAPSSIPTILRLVSLLYSRYLLLAEEKNMSADEIETLRRMFNNMVKGILDDPSGLPYQDLLKTMESKTSSPSPSIKAFLQ